MMLSLGLTPGASIDPDALDPAVRRGLVRACETGPNIVTWKMKYKGYKSKNGWNVGPKGGSFGVDYLTRAEGVIQGLILHDIEECPYFGTYHDTSGQPMSGENYYRIHFTKDAIARTDELGFWSLVAYDPTFNLVRNDAGRYSVQSSDDYVRNEDGSLTITVGPEPPGPLANYIGTRPGEAFRLVYRVYLPQPEMNDPNTLDQFLPPIEKII